MLLPSLPVPLLLLLLESLPFALAQQQIQQISLNEVFGQNVSQANSPLQFVIPPMSQTGQSQGPLNLLLSLCSGQVPIPRFIVNNSSMSTFPSLGDFQDGTFEVTLVNGLGTFGGTFANGGTLQAFVANDISSGVTLPPWAFQFALTPASTPSPLAPLSTFPLLGDTTASQVLIMSPAFSPYPLHQGTYPSFTLPAVNFTQPIPPTSNTPNFTVLLFPTSSLPGLQNSACGILEGFAESPLYDLNSVNQNSSVITRGIEGFRTQWIVQGNLQPQTNYTAYVVQGSTRVSQPINLATKSSSFSCPLVHSLPYCPRIANTVPLSTPPNSPSGFIFDSTTLPQSVSGPLLSSLNNFTKSLLIHPCGRAESDFSPLKGCDDCWDAYRNWVCAVGFPRCADPAPTPSNSFAPTPAFLVQSPSSTPRSPILPALTQPQTIILPCHELCTAPVRNCPPLLQFACPLVDVNANMSYGVGYIDRVEGSNVFPGGGSVAGLVDGSAVDQWGGVWCSGL